MRPTPTRTWLTADRDRRACVGLRWARDCRSTPGTDPIAAPLARTQCLTPAPQPQSAVQPNGSLVSPNLGEVTRHNSRAFFYRDNLIDRNVRDIFHRAA